MTIARLFFIVVAGGPMAVAMAGVGLVVGLVFLEIGRAIRARIVMGGGDWR
jgi:hypothetical protein